MTPASGLGSAGVSIIEIRSDATDDLLSALGVGALAVGQRRLVWRDGPRESVVARLSQDRVLVMPHAGAAVLRLVHATLTDAGVAEACDPEPGDLALEGLDELAAESVWRVASDAGARLVLAQPERWRASGLDPAEADDAMRDRARVLRRLVEPPTVALVGAPNIGKSTLTNVIAGRGVAMVADEPGVTRDHVSVLVDLDGLIVRWLDTPGVTGAPDDEAGRLAIDAARHADLVLVAIDPITPAPHGLGLPRGLRVRLRDDLDGRFGGGAVDLALSVQRGDPLDALVVAVRETLVPASVMEDPAPWAFWLSVWPDRVQEAGRSPSLKSPS